MRTIIVIFMLIALAILPTLALSPPDTLIVAGPAGTLNTKDFVFCWTGSTSTPDSFIRGFYYRLDSGQWNWTQDRVLAYYDMPEGSHRLEVKAVDSNNVEDPSPASLSFTLQRNFAVEPNESPFSVQREFQSQLDSGIISDGLRREFANNGKSLSQNAAVSVVTSGSRWLITDGNNIYKLRKEGNRLNVYQEDLLFRMDSVLQDDLDGGTVTADLQSEFEDNDIKLSQNASVSVVSQGSEWLVDGKYTVRKERDRLNVYEDELQFGIELFQHIVSYLDIRVVSDGLKQEFKNNGITLSQNASVSVDDPGKKWMITDSVIGKVFIVSKESNRNVLNIYESINDKASEAISLTSGTAIRCKSLPDSDDSSGIDEDWFRISVGGGVLQQMNVFFSRPDSIGSTVIRIYRYPEVGEGREIGRFTARYRAFFATGVTTGDYLIRVTPGTDENPAAEYSLTATAGSLPSQVVWEREPNDRSGDATESSSVSLSKASRWAEMVGNKWSSIDNKDYFKMHIDTDQPVRLSLNFSRPQNVTATIKLYPADLMSSEIGRFQVTPNSSPQWKLETSVKLGDYILEVELPADQSPDYLYFLTLQLSDFPSGEVWELEPNDFPGLANRLPIGVRFRAAKSHAADAKDWYRLTIPRDGILNLTTSRILKTGALNIYSMDSILLNPVGAPLSYQIQEDRQKDYFNMDILAGDYLLEVDLTKLTGDYWLIAQIFKSVEHDAPTDVPLAVGDKLNVRLVWEPGNSATFDIFEVLSGGTYGEKPLNSSPGTLYDDGLHSDGLPNDGIYAGTYVVEDTTSSGVLQSTMKDARVIVHLQDKAGNTADVPIPKKLTIDISPPDITPPEIRKVSHDAAEPLRNGQRLTVTIEGEAGNTAAFDIGEIIKEVSAYDDGKHNDGAANDGKYMGSYMVKAEDYVPEAIVTGHLADKAGNVASLDAPTLVDIVGNRPVIRSVEHDGRLTLGLAHVLKVTLIGDPNGIANFDIEGLVNNVPMYDDGQHDDGIRGDGKYVGSYKVAKGNEVISASVTAHLADRNGRETTKTAYVKVTIDAISPAPVVGVKAYDRPDDQGRFITLSWNPSTEPDFAHYNIYVSRGIPITQGRLPAISHITDPRITSFHVEVDADLTDYFFAVTAVDIMQNESMLAGDGSSNAGPVQAKDNLKPAPVKAVRAVDRDGDFGGMIILSWTDVNQDADFARYNIYREANPIVSTTGLKPVDNILDRYMTIVDIPVPQTDMMETSSASLDFYFAVTAVDLSGNESGLDSGSVAGPVRAINNLGTEPAGPVKILSGPVGTIHHDHVAFHLSRYPASSIQYPVSSIQGYYFRLDDANWQWSTSSTAVYHNLSPGSHTFSVRLSEGNAVSRSFDVVPVSTLEREPNDSQDTACVIRAGVIVRGESAASDWFRIHIPAGGGVVNVLFSRTGGVGSTRVFVYKAQPFREMGYFDSSSGQPGYFTFGVAGEADYLIRLDPADTGSIYKLVVTSDTLPQGVLWEVEDNDAGASANQLPITDTASVEVIGSSKAVQDIDYFRIHIPANSQHPVWMNISFYRPDPEAITTVKIYSSAPDIKDRQIGEFSVGALNFDFSSLVKGDYFIRVDNGDERAFKPYHFLLSLSDTPVEEGTAWELEPNNLAVWANNLSVGVKQRGTNWDGDKDDDWYVFNVKARSILSLYFSRPSGIGSTVVELYNSALVSVAKLRVDSAQKGSFNLSVEPGKYYVKIDPQAESPSAEYGLTVLLVESITLTRLSATGERIERDGRPLKAGDVIQLSLVWSTANTSAKATYDIGDVVANVPMSDLFKGAYTVAEGDNQISAPIKVHLVDPYQNTADIELDETVSIDTTPPGIQETSHNGLKPFAGGEKLSIRMLGEPGGSAKFDIVGFKTGLDMYNMTADVADPPLVILNWDWRPDPPSGIIVAGKIKNISGSLRDRVKLAITFYDADNNAINNISAFTIPRNVPPGAIASFKIYSKYTGKEKSARIKLLYGADEKIAGESADEGVYIGDYQIGADDNVSDAFIICYLTDSAGNQSMAQADQKVTFDTVPPVIRALAHDADGILVENDVLTVTMEVGRAGEPDGIATFDIGNFRKGLEMQKTDTSGSKYVGAYNVRAGDEVTGALITGYLKDAAGNTTSYVGARSVTINTSAPSITVVIHNAGARPFIQTEALTVTANTNPGAAVTFKVDGLTSDVPMHDDGQHGDGDPGDGVYKGSYIIRKGDNLKGGRVKVTAVNPNGKSVVREALETISVDTEPPAAVTGVRAADRPGDEGGYIILSWTPSKAEDFHHYNIYQSEQPIISLSGLKPLDTDIPILDPGCSMLDPKCSKAQIPVSSIQYPASSIQKFYFAVTVVDIATNESTLARESTDGPASGIDNLPPPPVQKVSGYDRAYDNGKVITVVWTEPSPAEDFYRYHVYMSTAPKNFSSLLANLTPVDVGITDRNVLMADIVVSEDRVPYFFAVTAIDFSGNESQINSGSVAGPISSEDNLGVAPDTLIRIISGPVGEIHYDDVTFRWTRWFKANAEAKLGYYYKIDNGNWVWSNEPEKTFYDLREGQHTFSVKADLGPGVNDLLPASRTFAVKRISISETEPNDSSERASWMSKGMTISGANASGGDDDWYRFHVESDGIMTLQFSRISGTGETIISIFSAPTQEAKIGTIVANPISQRKSFSTGVDLGDYFVLVDGPESKYEIFVTTSELPDNVKWDKESNDLPGSSQLVILPVFSIQHPASSIEISGFGNKAGDLDWYRLSIPELSEGVIIRLNIDFLRLQGIGSTNMAVYSALAAEASRVGSVVLQPTNNQMGQLSVSVVSGEYLLRVDNSQEADMSSIYSFRVSITPASDKWELEPNGVMQFASLLSINEVIKGTSWDPDGDLDWYKMRLDKQGILVLSFFRPFGTGSAEIQLKRSNGVEIAQSRASLLTGQKATVSADLNLGDYFVLVAPENEGDVSAEYQLVATNLDSVKLDIEYNKPVSPLAHEPISLLSIGDTISLTVVWKPGEMLSFDIGQLRIGLPVYDDGIHGDEGAGDGVYVGTYAVKEGDDVSSAEVVLHLLMPVAKFVGQASGWTADLKLEDKISIDTIPPKILKVDHNARLRPLTAGEELKVTMTGEAGAREAFFDIVLKASAVNQTASMFQEIPMKEEPPGTYSGSYTVDERDSLNGASVICHLIDAAGNESIRSAEWPISFDATPPEIIKISHDASKVLIEGDVLTVTVSSDTAKGKATFSIGNLLKDRAMYDDGTHGDKVADDAVYTGQYTVRKGDNITDGIITIRLIDEAGNASEGKAFEPVSIDTTPPVIASLVHNASGILSEDDILTVTMKGDPGNIAVFDIGDFQMGLPMYDDGTRLDKTPNDGIYVGSYTVKKGNIARDMRIAAYLTDKNGNQAVSRVFERVNIDAVAPLPVTGVKAVDKPDDQGFWIILTWQPSTSEDFDHYNIYRESAPITSVLGLTPIIFDNNDPNLRLITANRVDVIVPTNGVDYYLAVTVSDLAGNESPLASEGPVQALDNISPEPVTTVAAADKPSDQGKTVIVIWTKASAALDFDHYSIYMSGNPIVSLDSLKPVMEVKSVIDFPPDTIEALPAGLGVYLTVPSDEVDFYFAVTAFDKNGNQSALDTDGRSVAGPVRSLDDLPPQPVILVGAYDALHDNGGFLDILWEPKKYEEIREYRFYLSQQPIDNIMLQNLQPVDMVDSSKIKISDSFMVYKLKTPDDLVSFYVAVTAVDFSGNVSVLDKFGGSIAGPVQSVANFIRSGANTTVFAGFDPKTSAFIPAGAMNPQEVLDILWPDEPAQQKINEANRFLEKAHIDPRIDPYFADTAREFNASTDNILRPVKITLSYPDIEEIKKQISQEGLSQETEKQFRIFRLNQMSRIPKWELVSGVQKVDILRNTVSAETPMFGVFRVARLKLPENLDRVVVYPNPFIPSQSINGYITFKNLTENAAIQIYDMAGQRMRTIEPMAGGGDEAVWDVRNQKGDEVASGTYVFVIQGDNDTYIGKIVILR